MVFMKSTREMVAVSFAIVVTLFYLILSFYIFNPLMQADVNTIDNVISFYIDSLGSVEEGRIRIPIEGGIVSSVSVSYEKEGKYKDYGYEIDKDGWYVVVSYRFGKKYIKSASLIDTYPDDAGMATTITSPKEVCVVKTRFSEYPEVMEC